MSNGTAPSDRRGLAPRDANGTPLQWANRRGSEPTEQASDDIVGHDSGDQDGNNAEPNYKYAEQAKENCSRDCGKDRNKHSEREGTRHAGGDTADCVAHRHILTRV